MKRYKIWCSEIQFIEVARETKKSYFTIDRTGRERRSLKDRDYFNDFKSARNTLWNRIESRINSQKEDIKDDREKLSKIKALKEKDITAEY